MFKLRIAITIPGRATVVKRHDVRARSEGKQAVRTGFSRGLYCRGDGHGPRGGYDC